MNVFVVLFRGINVGGHKVVRMAALCDALGAAGFGHVETYIQSGNVVLTSSKDAGAVTSEIEVVFTAAFGFSSKPTVRDRMAWRHIVDSNPFPEESANHKTVSAVVFDGRPPEGALAALCALAGTERFELKGDVLYLHAPDGFGRSKVAASLDKLLEVPLTTRNWRTVLTLMDMADKAASNA